MATWIFRKKSPAEKSRNPMQDEFFASNSEAGALVREAIQNSLDARLDENHPVRVRFLIANDTKRLDWDATTEWIDSEAWNHFKVSGSGLKDIPSDDSGCPFLVYEDFNTKGLNGDILQNAECDGVKNAFYYFLRAEGQSDKKEGELGSWGVGKIVFPKSSRLRAIFVLTTRSEDSKTYLSGQSILKYHKVGEQVYSPDGWYGDTGEKEFGLPIDDSQVINRFSEVFNLSRKDETGLSLIVPWPDENITFDNLARSVIEEYFYSILTKKLEVLIETDDMLVQLSKDTLLDEVEKFDTSPEKSLIQLVELAASALTQPKNQIIKLPKYVGNKPEWQSEMISEELVDEIWKILDSDEPVTIRVPLDIQHKESTSIEATFFDVVIKKAKDNVTKPVFVRDGLVITKVLRPRSPGFISLVSIFDSPLKKLLGRAENPAHTEWNEGSDHFKGKYLYGRDYLNFVRLSVKRVIQHIQKDDEEADASILADLFSIPQSGNAPKPASTPDPGPDVEPPVIPDIEPPKEPYYKLIQLDNGFRVTGKKEFSQQREYNIVMAYDIVKGNPFNKWHEADFLAQDLTVKINNLNDYIAIDKYIKFTVNNNQFDIEVTGFDINRDLKVRVTSKVMENA